MKQLFCGLMALGLFLGMAGQAKAQYIYTTIDVPGSSYTQAFGINDSAQIVGEYVAGGIFHGFLLSGGIFTTIDVPASTGTAGDGINHSGQIVGNYFADGTQHGFLATRVK